jgi:hypothetical protein
MPAELSAAGIVKQRHQQSFEPTGAQWFEQCAVVSVATTLLRPEGLSGRMGVTGCKKANDASTSSFRP